MTIRKERGQALVVTVLFFTVLLGATALSLDVGSWYWAKRQLQADADSAALAGAQALPDSTANAQTLAIQYAGKNGGTLDGSGVSFSSGAAANDTINVHMSAPAPGFFSKLFGIDSVTVGARASARTGTIDQAFYAAPVGVNLSHPDLSGPGCPCFGDPTMLTLGLVGPGGFKLLNIDGSTGGTNPNVLASWMQGGLNAWMPLGDYYSDPGAKFNNGGMQDALSARVGTDLLFPVYDRVDDEGSNLFYHVVGWVGFHLTSYGPGGPGDDCTAKGNAGTLCGWFTEVIWQGIQAKSGDSDNPSNFGDYAVQLVN